MNTLDGTYILLQNGKPVFWKQKGPDGKEVAGLVIALTHKDAKRWSDWYYERHKKRISPYLVGSSDEHLGLNVAVWKAHDLGEKLDFVFVLDFDSEKPKFWFVPPEQLHDILHNE